MYRNKYIELKEFLETDIDFIQESKRLMISVNELSEEFAKKLMGQVAFLYFLQKKGWLGLQIVPFLEIDRVNLREIYKKNNEDIRNIITKVYKPCEEDLSKMELDRDVLNSLTDEEADWLASAFSNTEYDQEWGKGKRTFIRDIYISYKRHSKESNFFNSYLEPLFYEALNSKRGNHEYYKRFNCKIPFLNGGLFEPIYKYEWKTVNIQILDKFFSNENNDGLLDFFDLYNFTMNEDEPLEKEIAVDPEMLGKIFENLLDVKERKSKGAFYTPREIVHYMCQECLINYLSNETKVDTTSLELFIKYGDILKDTDLNIKDKNNYKMPKFIIDNLDIIDKALHNVTVADPAVGSGAFPLGMLNEIVNARSVITDYMTKDLNEWQKEDFINNNKRSLYELKKHAMKKSIFAVDIEPSAVDITKLRLWLSLVVDADTKTINTLPNLDYNIMVGNSLIDEFKGIKLFDEELLLKKSKRKLKNIENQISMNIEGTNVNIGIEQEENILEEIQALQNDLFDTKDTNKKIKIKKDIEDKEWELIEYKLNREKGLKFKEIEELKKQKKSNRRPYFLWKLEFSRVFKEKGGFDIVIGNPPYIKEMDNKHVFDIINKSSMGRKYHDGKMDFWYYFLHQGINIKNKNGVISYITPRYWINSKGAKKLIKRIKCELKFISVVDIGKLKVFDNVVGYHMIASYINKSNENYDKFIYKKLENNLEDINKLNNTENIKIEILNNIDIIKENFEISFENQNIDFSKYEKLKDFYEVSQGVIEAIDKVNKKTIEKFPEDDIAIGEGIFVLNKYELDNLDLNKNEAKVIKKYLNGSDIKRYNINFNNNYLIYSDKDTKKMIKNDNEFKNLKKHLDKYNKYITSSNKPYGIHRSRKNKFFESEKLIVKNMFKKPEIAYDIDANYVGMSCSTIIQKNQSYDLKFLIGILNSNLATYWFYKNGKKRGIGVDIGVQKLREFPICEYNKNEVIRLINLVNKVSELYKINDLNYIEVEKKINLEVYKLYDLTEREIDIIESFCDSI